MKGVGDRGIKHTHAASCCTSMHGAGPLLLPANCTSTLLCLSHAHRKPVNSKHLWASNTAEQVTDSTILIMVIPSLNTPSRPASESAINADKINI
jgi:hypothetical protein